MGATSSIGVKKAVRDLLQELPNLDGVDLLIAPPDDTTSDERIFFGDATFTHKPAGMRGGARVPRDETVDVDVFVEVWAAHPTSPEDVEARCVEIGQEFEECVADNAGGTGSDTSNGVYVRAITVRGGTVRTRPTDEGFASQIQYQLQADARLV